MQQHMFEPDSDGQDEQPRHQRLPKVRHMQRGSLCGVKPSPFSQINQRWPSQH